MSSFKLSDGQKTSFFEQGYVICGQLADDDQLQLLRDAYGQCLDALQDEGQLTNTRSGTGDDGAELGVYQIRAAHLQHASFNDLVRTPALLDAVEAIIGPNIRLCLMQGLYKPPRRGAAVTWHQDDRYFQVDKPDAVVSCWMTLDESTIDNGCMWVMPRHHLALAEHGRTIDGKGYEIADVTPEDEATAVACEMPAGHCMFHHGLAPHRSLPNTTDRPRRAMAMHFMDASARPRGDNRMDEPAENMPILRGRGLVW